MKRVKSQITTIIVSFVAAFAVVTATGQVVSVERSGDATLTVDRQRFPVSYRLDIRAEGFSAGEIVSLESRRKEIDGELTIVATWGVVASTDGSIQSEWFANAAGTFVIRATGETSGKIVESEDLSSVAPIVVTGNPSCATLNASTDPAFAHITRNWGLKIDPPAGGEFPFANGSGRTLTGGAPADSGNSVSVLNLTGTTFDWSATKLITAVIVKGGPNANVYPYSPESLNDTLLTTVGGGPAISNIQICFQNTKMPASVTIIKDAQPNTTAPFSFSATGQVVQNFNLVDNGVVGPDRVSFNNLNAFGAANKITVTEGVPGGFYQLTRINCTSNVTNNNTINIAARTVTIVLEPGENVVCTFVNTVVTAASTSVSGRVADGYGTPLVWARVSIQNVATGEIRYAYTNQFGRYRVEDLAVGDLYIATVEHRKRLFVFESVTFTLNDAVEDLDFIALEP